MRRELEISARSDGDKTIEHENGIGDTMSANAERQRLEEARGQHVPWRKCGPYLSERQWGTWARTTARTGTHGMSRDTMFLRQGSNLPGRPGPELPTGCAFGHDGRRGSIRPIPGTAPVRYQHPADGVLSAPAWSSRGSPRARWTSGRWAVPQAGGEVKGEL